MAGVGRGEGTDFVLWAPPLDRTQDRTLDGGRKRKVGWDGFLIQD